MVPRTQEAGLEFSCLLGGFVWGPCAVVSQPVHQRLVVDVKLLSSGYSQTGGSNYIGFLPDPMTYLIKQWGLGTWRPRVPLRPMASYFWNEDALVVVSLGVCFPGHHRESHSLLHEPSP